MMTGARKQLTARDAYIIDKHKKNFTPTEILTMMKRDGFTPVARSRIYQILDENKARNGKQ